MRLVDEINGHVADIGMRMGEEHGPRVITGEHLAGIAVDAMRAIVAPHDEVVVLRREVRALKERVRALSLDLDIERGVSQLLAEAYGPGVPAADTDADVLARAAEAGEA